MPTLNIAYCNVRGLNNQCLLTLISDIHNNNYDFIIATETWYMNRLQYLSHSFFLAESTYPASVNPHRRRDGGLLLLTSTAIRPNMSVLSTSSYHIKIKLKNSNKILAFIYFPPSLSDESIAHELDIIGYVDAIIGDFNIRLGKLSGDQTSTAPSRRRILYNYLPLFHLNYLRNSNSDAISRTDHIFTNLSNISWEYIQPTTFRTDHQIMSLQLINTESLNSNQNSNSTRYDYKPLYNKYFKNEFVNLFDQYYATNILIDCEGCLRTSCYSMILPSTDETQELIDNTYSYFIDTIKSLMDMTLSTYNIHISKTKPDTLLTSINSPKSNSHIMRCFKRSQRTLNANSPIIAADASKTPLEECTEHYSNQFSSNEPTPSLERQNDIEFSQNFTEKRIRERILSYSNIKSSGPDEIHSLVWKTLTHSYLFMRSLSALFQLFAATSLVPSAWSVCNLHLLKKDESNPIASNTRPIALSNILRRIFEKILLNQWLHSNTTDWTHLNYGQAGFRHGYSTMSHLVLSDELSRRSNDYSIFLDIKSAFDSVSWKKLNSLLISKQCPSTHRNLILSLICKPATLLLSVNQSERTTIYTKKGVFQGGGISAFVFALYIDPLAAAINVNSPTHHPLGLFFADDIQIKSSTISEAQLAIDKCSSYGKEFQLQWNLSKCATVSRTPTTFYLNQEPLICASQYKYLGIIHKWNGLDLETSFTASIIKAQNLLTAISDNAWHPKSKLTIYRSFIRPITEYSAVLTYLWAKKSPTRLHLLTLMKTFHQTALAWIFNRPRYSQILDFLSGLGPWDYRLDSLHGGLARSFDNLHDDNPLLAARLMYPISASNHFILQHCFKSPYWFMYQTAKMKHLTFPLRWKTWQRSKLKLLASEAAKSSATITYLLPYNIYAIRATFHLPTATLNTLLSWRLNSFSFRQLCICHSTFTRSHVDCILHQDELYETVLESPHYLRSLRHASTSKATTYCVLDYLLNNEELDTFFYLVSLLQSQLLPN